MDGLIQRGCEVHVIDNMLTGRLANLEHLAKNRMFHFIRGDIRDSEVVGKALKDVDVVFHEAALVSVSRSVEDPKLTNDINVTGTVNTLLSCLKADVNLFVYASSSSVYGEAGKLPKDERQTLNPISPYGVSKMAAENYATAFHEVYGLKAVCLRYFNVYGPRQIAGPYSGVISIFVSRLRNNQPPIIYGDGEQMRDFTYVKDVVNANMLCLEGREAVGQVFNIATGKPTTINRLSQILVETTGRTDLQPTHTDPRSGDIKESYADISKAKKTLKYCPEMSLQAGLSSYVAWHDANLNKFGSGI